MPCVRLNASSADKFSNLINIINTFNFAKANRFQLKCAHQCWLIETMIIYKLSFFEELTV